jgi:putative PIN family toxin of toxin-antitoxin system
MSSMNSATDEVKTVAPTGETLRLVLDTNVVLDWLLFADPLTGSLALCVGNGRVTLLTHAPAMAELHRVLRYDAFKLDEARRTDLLDRYRRNTDEAALPIGFALDNLLLPDNFPCCKDADDQHFLALAYHTHADALITRDKALLALRKRARKFGVAIVDVRQLPVFLSPI